jgi:hypothetical protein
MWFWLDASFSFWNFSSRCVCRVEFLSEQKSEVISPECILYFARCTWKRATNWNRAVHTHRASTENVWPLYQHLGRIDVNRFVDCRFSCLRSVWMSKSYGFRLSLMAKRSSLCGQKPVFLNGHQIQMALQRQDFVRVDDNDATSWPLVSRTTRLQFGNAVEYPSVLGLTQQYYVKAV